MNILDGDGKPSKTAEVKKQIATLFRGDMNPPVYLLPDGRFAALCDGVWKLATTLVGLKRSLAKQFAPVKVFRLHDPEDVFEVSAIVHNQLVQTNGVKHSMRWRAFHFFDEAMQKKLIAHHKRREKARVAYDKITDRLEAEYDQIVSSAVEVSATTLLQRQREE